MKIIKRDKLTKQDVFHFILLFVYVIVTVFILFFISNTHIPLLLKVVSFLPFVAWFFFCGIAFIELLRVKLRKRIYFEAGGEDILIIAPHQDDCAIIAGGYAIQTLKKNGKVTILFLTDGYEGDKITRKNEAYDAWAVVNLPKEQLHFFKYHCFTGLIEVEEVESCIKQTSEFIKKVKPDTIFIPLYEGGNYQHDIANFIVRQVLEMDNVQAKVYEASEYNFYFSFKNTPERILAACARIIPFFSYMYPPESVRQEPVYYLNMTADEIETKCKILSRFTTQNPEDLIQRFRFVDRFQEFIKYDYSVSPFQYEGSFAQMVNKLKKNPHIGKYVSKVLRWTKTIHPDPDYEMTTIEYNPSAKKDQKRV